MKYLILFFTTLSFFTSEVNAQNEYAYNSASFDKITPTSSPKLSSEEKQMLTVSDISEMLSMHLEYPDEMISYGLEGSCTLVINLSKKGSLISYEIEDSMGLLFDKEIKHVLEENKELLVGDAKSNQKGLRVKMPIYFRF